MANKEERLINTFCMLTQSIQDLMNTEKIREQSCSVNGFHYIASLNKNYYKLLTVLKHLKMNKNINFIDAGCGVSGILLFMYYLGYKNLSGVEINNHYIRVMRLMGARKGDHPFNILRKSILDYNFNKYDFIYSYKPINDKEKYMKFVENLAKTMKKGAIWLEALIFEKELHEKVNTAHNDRFNIFIKEEEEKIIKSCNYMASLGKYYTYYNISSYYDDIFYLIKKRFKSYKIKCTICERHKNEIDAYGDKRLLISWGNESLIKEE